MMMELSEQELQAQVTELAELLGWSWVHFRPGRTVRGWRTPVEGPLGKGWPDLLLVKPGRVLAVELKAGKRKATPEQLQVLQVLAAAGIETAVWRSEDWDQLGQVLR